MTSPLQRRLTTLIAAFLVLVSLPAAAAEPARPAAKKGDSWETTSQMSMEGMPMALPAQRMKICAQKDQPPVAADEHHKCTNSDFKKDGAKVTWKTVCAGSPEMTGEGEITYTDADNYTGSIKFTSSEGKMMVKLTGRRLGECELSK